MSKWNLLFTLAKQFKNTSDIPHLTEGLQSSSTFRKACFAIHNAKERIKKQIHDEAFPDDKHKEIEERYHTHDHHRHNHKK
jgi:hypothetical protein